MESFDDVLRGIQEDQPDTVAMDAAAARVWAQLKEERTEPASFCEHFRAMLPLRAAGTLPPAKAMLLDDHLHECVACRKVAQGRETVTEIPVRKAVPKPLYRWAVAAMLVAGAGVSAWFVWEQYGSTTVAYASVQSIDGMLYRIDGNNSKALHAGDQVPYGQIVRTALGSGAMLRLGDGSTVEMRERSDLAVGQTRRDLTIRLGLGGVIVQAAKRKTGHLYVATRDCKVAVTGTVFGVDAGAKGSRVSVVEGEVHVAQNGKDAVLHRGDQYTSSATMQKTPVRDEIAWSRNREQHEALLRDLAGLKQSLDNIKMPQARYQSRFLGSMPANTAIYVAVPNISNALEQAQQIINQKMQESAPLKAWMAQTESHGGPKLNEVLDHIRGFGEYLGDEVVIAASIENGHLSEPFILAETKKPGLREYVEGKMPREARNSGMALTVQNNVVMMSGKGAAQNALAASGGKDSGFTNTAFGKRVSDAYRDGAGILFALDLERLIGPKKTPETGNVKYLVVEQKDNAGAQTTSAVLTFEGAREGIASWLAAPAPLGVLDFITPEATVVSAFAVKRPATIIEQIESWSKAAERRHHDDLDPRLRDDLTAPLGGEFALAMDGPALPTPAWKVVVEVYDPARLQGALERLVQSSNGHLTMSQQAAGSRTYYRITVANAETPISEVNYMFADGYLVAAPSRNLLDQAIQMRANGMGLTRSSAFTQLMPHDRYGTFSGVVYYSLPVANIKPTLVAAYGEEDRIRVSTSGSILGLSMSNLMMLQAPQQLMEKKLHAVGK